MNDLDRAITAAIRSKAMMPDLFRTLIADELWFLVPYHPELDGGIIELKPGMPLPFVQLADSKGTVVPIFSSEERVDEGLGKGNVTPGTYAPAAMPAVQLLGIVGRAGLRAVLNKSCKTGEIILPPELLRDLADGTALRPHPMESEETVHQGELKQVDPADYPTELVQRLFEAMRRHTHFRAAWIFTFPDDGKRPAEPPHYQVLVHMDPRDDTVLHDLSLVARTRSDSLENVDLGLLDEKDQAYIEDLRRRVQPFYVAAK